MGTKVSVPNTKMQLFRVLAYLKDWFLPEQLPEDAPAAPDVDRRAVPLLAEQEFRRSVPERDHLVGVRSLPVLGVVEPGETKVGQLHLEHNTTTFSYHPYQRLECATESNRNMNKFR